MGWAAEQLRLTVQIVAKLAGQNTFAQATTIAATVDEDAVLRVRVSNDGRGGADIGGGSDRLGLKDRVESAAGRLSLRSVPGAGATVHVKFP